MNSRKLALPLLVAFACVALAAIPAWGSAAPKHKGSDQTATAPLRITSVAVGTKTGPLTVKVRANVHAQVELKVNGHKVSHPFESTSETVQRIELSATDGLRPGANKLRLQAIRAGVVSTATRTVRVPGWALLADAGEDTSTYVDTHTRLGTQPLLGAAGGAKVKYTWKVADGPRGAKTKLVGQGKAEPLLKATEPGTYVLQEEANPSTPGEPTSYDQVSVPVAADVPPIGLKLDTNRNGQIGIGDQGFGSLGSTGMAYAIFERTTGTVVESGHVDDSSAGMSTLNSLADRYGTGGNYMRYLIILSGNKGVSKDQIGAFAGVMKKIGVALPTQENFIALEVGLPFSIVGVPGAPAGAATTRIPGGGYNPPISGAMTGYLQKNQAVNTEGAPVYEYVAGENVEYDTRADGSNGTKNVMTVNGQKYEASLPAGATAGFHLVVLESLTLRPIANMALVTNAAGGSDRTRQDEAAKKLRAETDKPGGPVVLLQTIGKPKAAGPEWAGVVSQMTKLGANPQLVNALSGSNEYAFVGRYSAEAPPAESSTAQDQNPYKGQAPPPARLIGVLSRGRTSNFVPNVSSTPPANRPAGLVNIGLMKVAYQAPQAWPDLAPTATRDEASKAARFLCEGLNFCQSVDSCESIRECFWKKYNSDWSTKVNKFADIKFVAGKGFTSATFDTVKEELKTETEEVAEIHTWLGKLLAPVEQSSGASYVDLQAIGNKVWESVQRPAADNSTSWVLGLIGKAAALGGFAGPPVSAAAAGISAAFGLASYLSNKSGQPILGTEIRVRSGELAKEVYARVQLAREATTALGMLIVSDYGKLTATYPHIDSDWSAPDPARADEALSTGSKQWFYEALIPTAYPYLIRATGVSNARSLQCGRTAWPNQPDVNQMNAITGYSTNGTPITSVFYFTQGIGGGASPPAGLGEDMFRQTNDPDHAGLGIEKLNFFTARVFNGEIAHAINNWNGCAVGWLPGK
ncbi:MAG TPA: hypothetical protein VH299_02300 [Solirubrobacterales bacterium]|jgi:hypothetical protein|nr:hypothetical protein [Solirubrobacterales bacterium]